MNGLDTKSLSRDEYIMIINRLKMNSMLYKYKIVCEGWIRYIRADNEQQAKEQALVELSYNGFLRVNDDDLVMEVERVYVTRIDCMVEPEGVRRVAYSYNYNNILRVSMLKYYNIMLER